jgi:integrase/recombinase XerD
MKAPCLSAYRRHLKTCPHADKGRDYTLCQCPIHAYGWLNGAIYQRSLHTTDAATANRRMDALLANPDDPGILPAAKALTVSAAVEAYLSDCSARKLARSTLRSYTDVLRAFAKHAGNRGISQVDATLVRSFRAGRDVTVRTQRKEIEHLRAFCAFCLSNRWIAENPAKKIKPPRVEDLATLPFSEEEVQQLLSACDRLRSDQKRARALLLTLLYSGLRVGDVAQLRRARLEKSGHLVLRTEKTGAPVKVLLHEDARTALRALPAPGGNPAHFFWTGKGKTSSIVGSLRRTVDTVGKIAGIHAHPHRFRDTFAVELLTHGADIFTVQRLLGHESVKTTQKHYAHFVAAHQALLDSAAAKLDFRPPAARPLLVDALKNRRRDAK